jgi:hypothetical protein
MFSIFYRSSTVAVAHRQRRFKIVPSRYSCRRGYPDHRRFVPSLIIRKFSFLPNSNFNSSLNSNLCGKFFSSDYIMQSEVPIFGDIFIYILYFYILSPFVFLSYFPFPFSNPNHHLGFNSISLLLPSD